MIYSIQGTPGSGKTNYLLSKVLPQFLRGISANGELTCPEIWHNVENFDPYLYLSRLGIKSGVEYLASRFHEIGVTYDEYGNKTYDEEKAKYFWYDPAAIVWKYVPNESGKSVKTADPDKSRMISAGAIIAIDECQNLYPSRGFKSQASLDCIYFLALHRHWKYTIFWLTQAIDMVDITFRRTAEQVYKLESLEIYGKKHTSALKKFQGWETEGFEPYAKSDFTHDKKMFGVYGSFKEGVSENLKEIRITDNIFLSNKPLMFVVLLIVAFIVYLVVSGGPMKTQKDILAKSSKGHATPTATAPAPLQRGFSPEGGEAGANLQCYVNSWVTRYQKYYKLPSGEIVKQRQGVNYVLCDNTTY